MHKYMRLQLSFTSYSTPVFIFEDVTKTEILIDICLTERFLLTADGTPRVKRPYVKRSEIWNNKGKRKKKHSMEKISPKVCESTNDTVESKPGTCMWSSSTNDY